MEKVMYFLVGLIILLFISVLPGILIGKYIYKKDKDKKPKKIIIKLLVFGVLFAILAAILEELYDFVFPNSKTFFSMLCQYIIGVGLIEEFSKFLPAYFMGIKSKYFDDIYDSIFFTAFSALGFAVFENIFYVLFDGGVTIAILRFFISVPGHIAVAIIMGYFIGIAYQYKNNNNIRKFRVTMFYSIFIPALFHGLGDFGIVYGVEHINLFTILISILTSVSIIIYSIKKVKYISNKNEKISNNILNYNNTGLKFLGVGILIVLLMFSASKIDLLKCLNMYTIDENVTIKEKSIDIKVDSYEETTISDENYVIVNLAIENKSDESNALAFSNFYLVDFSGKILEQDSNHYNNDLPDTIDVGQNDTISLYFKQNKSESDKGDYAFIYYSSEEYEVIFLKNKTDLTKSK